ncbi:MAG: hypothetical protein GX589_02550 [Deltaproteobacteria bacterium]|nr:hypothetical protein [Deltaproteobacteria bacterium]
MPGDFWQITVVLLGGIATLGIYSFLIKENPVFRFFEHLFIGIAAGLGSVLAVKNFLWPRILKPLLGLDIVTYPDGTSSHAYNPLLLLYIAPMLFGLLYYFIYSKKHAWLAKLVIGFSLGMAGGLAFKGFFNQMLPQLFSSFKPLVVMTETGVDLWRSLENTFFVFTLLIVMYYFFFSFNFSIKRSGKLSYAGRWLLMVCFGAFFGSTIMARLSLLVERLEFLLGDFRLTLTALFL